MNTEILDILNSYYGADLTKLQHGLELDSHFSGLGFDHSSGLGLGLDSDSICFGLGFESVSF